MSSKNISSILESVTEGSEQAVLERRIRVCLPFSSQQGGL